MSNPVNDLDEGAGSSAALDKVARGRRTISLIMIVAGLLFTVASLRLDRGDMAHPGPGLFPILVGVLAMISGVGGLLELRRGQVGAPSDEAPTGAKPWYFIGAMMAGVVLLPTLGFMVSAFVTATAVSWTAGQKTWWKALLIGLSIALISTILFREILDVNLPSSVLDEWL